MAVASKSELAKQRDMAYRKRMMGKSYDSKPEIDEKSLYISLKYDVDNGRKLPPDKKKKFEELKKKYGQK